MNNNLSIVLEPGELVVIKINENNLQKENKILEITPGEEFNLKITNTHTVNTDGEIWKGGNEIFNELLHKFDNTLFENDTLNSIYRKPITANYLLSMYNIADNEWNKNIEESLFNSDLYFEPADYRSDNKEGDLDTYKAMQAWLIATCLSEITPSTGTTTNNQTKLFKCAYDNYGNNDLYKVGSADDNGNIIKENNYGIKQDATIARYVASILYAINHDSNVNIINKCRQEFNSNCINTKDFDYVKNNKIGYFVNGDDIFGPPPGPFISSTNGYHPENKKPSKQNSSLFFENNNANNWYDYNYKMDVAIDKYVMEHYNLYATDTNYASDPIETYDRTTENDNAFKNNNYNIKKILVDTGIIPGAHDFMWHGKKRIKYTGIKKVEVNYNGKYTYMHNFELASENETGENVFEYIGPYYIESMPKLWYENPSISTLVDGEEIQGKQTDDMKFMCYIRGQADDHRQRSYEKEYGRRRPLGGITVGTTRRNNRQDSALNGINKHLAARFCVDTRTKYNALTQIYSNGQNYSDGMNADDFPHDRPASWPSGHACQTWAPALYLCQMFGNNSNEVINIIKRSYRLGSLRSIGRFHWNSDILYGRLYGCMFLPLLNANKKLISDYNKLKAKLCNNAKIPDLIDGGSGDRDIMNENTNGTCTVIDDNTLKDNQIKFELTNNSGEAITIQPKIRFILNKQGNIIRTNHLVFDNISENQTINNGETKTYLITVAEQEYFGNKFSATFNVNNEEYTSNILLYDNNGISHTFKSPALQMFSYNETFRNKAIYKVEYERVSSNYNNYQNDNNTNTDASSISFTLKISNSMTNEDVRLNGEFYMFMDCYENGKLTSDNTGKHMHNGGLTLISNPNISINSIVIKPGEQKDFRITIPASTINRLSTNVSPKSRCYGHQSNIIFYTYGKWPNSQAQGGWQSGGISDSYIHACIDNNDNGFTLLNNSVHTVNITDSSHNSSIIL